MSVENLAPILVGGAWRPAQAVGSFHAEDPATGAVLPEAYPVSDWSDVEAALDAAVTAFAALQEAPAEGRATFLRTYADGLEACAPEICAAAALETGYPVSPRLKDVELPRTVGQLRQAAAAAGDPSWRLPVVDAKADIRSVLEPIGPVAVFGPNNFPLAFNGISGGDFAAAIAAGNPVIAKAHSGHPGTCRRLAACAAQAAEVAGLPAGTVQVLFGLRREDGRRLAADPRLGAVAFTGSREAGLALKAAADAAGNPVFLEMSSVNPVVILPGALAERPDEMVRDLVTSALMGSGQFCTNPGLVFLVAGARTEAFLAAVAQQYAAAPCGTLLSRSTQAGLVAGIGALTAAGAEVVTGAKPAGRPGYAWANTLLRVAGAQFLAKPGALQTEAFGNATLAVVATDAAQLLQLVARCEGSLTGCVYSALDGSEDGLYTAVARVLRPRVGRLLNDKMPTGVAVSPAMNHGGPFPAAGHPHFTSVGLPAAMRRFTRLACYDHVRPHRLPAVLRS